MLRYVWRDLMRNPRRTVASVLGVTLGVGLFSGILFFVDGSGASMTRRALAPLAIDMQVVMNAPLGRGVELDERLEGPRRLRRAAQARVVLTVRNHGGVPGHDVVVVDQPPAPLAYVHGTTTKNGRRVADRGGDPLSQGLAGTGLDIGTVPPGATVRVAYRARARRPVADVARLRLGGKISTREDLVPADANAAPQLTLAQLTARLERIPGVAAADGLAFVDLPARSLRAGGRPLHRVVRLFGFDDRYRRHYPSIRLVSGGLRPGSAVLSAEAARRLGPAAEANVTLRVPGGRHPLTLPVAGIADLSDARPLFASRKSSKLEEFLYVPDSLIVSPAQFQHDVIPRFRAAAARRGTTLKSLPFLEADVLVDRASLDADPARALAQTKRIARAIARVAPGQQYVIDNASNTLQVARDDAAVGKRMFLFLGLPGALLAAFLAAYTAGVLAATQRREHANLRIRGAHRGHLRRILAYRTAIIAAAGALAGTALGLASARAILGADTLSAASTSALLVSVLVSIGFGMATTALALYLPARRSLRREISQERHELALGRPPAWRRYRLDLALLAAAAIAEALALHAGAFDAPPGSVYLGRAVSLPSHLLIAPVVAWFGGVLLAVRGFEAVARRVPAPAPPRFGPVVRGALARSVRRRSATVAGGAVAVGLIVAFGVALAVFSATYDAAKAADARFTVGSDLRVRPSVLSSRPHPAAFASTLRVAGIAAVAPVVFGLENSVLIGPDNQDRKNLAAIDPASFRRVAPLSDQLFPDTTAGAAMHALGTDRRALLVQRQSADDLGIEAGDRVALLLARGTRHQVLARFHVVGLYDDLPGFPQGVDVVVPLPAYTAATGLDDATFFLARTADRTAGGLDRAVRALRAGPGARDRLVIQTTATALDSDQSSLTALNVRGLVALDTFYTLLMSAAAVGIFVFGLMLQRRREYIALRAQGLQTGELRALVVGEAGVVAAGGVVAGLVVGVGVAHLIVHVLRPLFVLAPPVSVPAPELALLAGLAAAAALLCALAATTILRRLSPSEILRET